MGAVHFAIIIVRGFLRDRSALVIENLALRQ